jgi:two-component system, NarL family, nitrate/nitrite response regulator NarL
MSAAGSPSPQGGFDLGDHAIGDELPSRPGPIRVAIATDVALMRDGLLQVLANRPAIRVVAAAATRAEALAAASTHQPSFVLLDMSCAWGLELVRDLRAAAPVVGVVGFAIRDRDDDLLDSVQAGVVGFVLKDGAVEDLVAAVESAARGEALCPPRITAGLFRRLATLGSTQPTVPALPPLGAREQEIVQLIDRGLSNKAIAQQLNIGLATVKNHVHNILEKLSVTRRGEAVAVLRATAPRTATREVSPPYHSAPDNRARTNEKRD